MPKGVFPRTTRTPAEIKASLKRRLEEMSMPVPESGCVLFTGYVDALGYGIIAETKRKRVKAHRAAYSVFVCDIPDGMDVLHRCDVRSCINPAHLWLGTHAENMADMVAKGRSPSMKGSAHPMAVLSEQDVIHIRTSDEGCTSLARRLGVSATNIKDIRNRRIWRHI
jgi:hypothetical protein